MITTIFGKYAKFWTSLAGVAITVVSEYYGNNIWVTGLMAAGSALGVLGVPNAGTGGPAAADVQALIRDVRHLLSRTTPIPSRTAPASPNVTAPAQGTAPQVPVQPPPATGPMPVITDQ